MFNFAMLQGLILNDNDTEAITLQQIKKTKYIKKKWK